MKLDLQLDTREFERSVKRFARESKKNHKRTARAMFLELLRLVILKTPVDYGQARGGFGAGAEAVGVKVRDKGKGSDGERSYEGGRRLSEHQELETAFGIRIVTTNKVAHIELLEKGSSKQAPFGMLAISMRELEERMGGRKIPSGIFNIYQETWTKLGLDKGTELRAGQIAGALGFTHGAGGLD